MHRCKGGLPAIIGVDVYIVVTGSDVNLGEPLGISEFCDQGRNQWQWVSIPDHPFIDILIILAGSQIPSFLSDEKEPAGLRRLRRTDEVLSEVVIEEGFHSFCFFWGKGVRFGGFRDIARFCVDSMVNTRTVRWELVQSIFCKDVSVVMKVLRYQFLK